MGGVSSAIDRRPQVPGHAIGTLSIGPVRRVWCSCGWRWLQPDAAMPLADARQLERQAIHVHRALATAPTTVPGEEWVRDR
jgi:hypothetical protein